MSDSPEELDSAEELNDDTQLTIRIPNPKVYMARQSQWKGRRGKPRCDHCRMNNLRCDRVLPSCNHCSWVNGRECRYTPLPTPAHRGIPRCDRCRLRNLKCDRNLPVCNHCAEDSESECNYTPKKRHKVPSDSTTVRDKQTTPYGAKTASFLVSDVPSSEESGSAPRNGQEDSNDGHSFYGQNVASLSQSRRTRRSISDVSRRDGSSPHNNETPEPSGRQTASSSSLHSLPPRQTHNTNKLSFISHSFSDKGAIPPKALAEFWAHPLFAPLPEAIVQRISNVNPVEMPNRELFEENFTRFLGGLPPELLETAAFTPEAYADVCCYLSSSDAVNLSDRLKMWVSFHHVRLGSEKYHLLLIPRDAFFHLPASEEEKLRKDYISHIDNHPNASSTSATSSKLDIIDHDLVGFEWTRAFERIPVRSQIYDILVYAHRTHGSAASMVFETRRIGMAAITWPMIEMFIQLCPLCSLRTKPSPSRSIKADTPHDENVRPSASRS